MRGQLYLVGFGPGNAANLTYRAREVIAASDVVVGYRTYIELIRDLLDGKEVFMTGMQEEVDRAKRAVDLAEQGRTVAVVSSGDAGIYGMAGLVYEVLRERGWRPGQGIGVEVVPGVSALNACAALVGAPLMNDFVAISLSDYLTPWDLIVRRLHAAGAADFVVVLYNPASGRRTQQIVETREILLRYRSPQTPVAIVKSAYRDLQDIVVTDLEHMLEHPIGMLTTIIIGNSQTFVHEGLVITPRGYQRKYSLAGD
ncbi:MAG: precorrin-3B C(17)-methyltransferase [Clostridia bacterium]|nr:precorrin-3B C(17)-methyltransferase [Clostridia bacterium]